MEKEAALLEAIFFLEAEPLDNNALSKISGLGPEIIEPVLEHLQEKYTSEDSGIELVQISGGWIVAPKAELWESLKERYGKKSDKKLSRSAMETLSISIIEVTNFAFVAIQLSIANFIFTSFFF